MNSVACRVVVRGRVQGVGFRAFVEYEASRQHLAGWVRNRRDGSVEAVFVGAQENVDAMIAVCRAGPPSARVDGVDQREAAAPEAAVSAARFSVLPTV